MDIDPARGWAVEAVFDSDKRLCGVLEKMHADPEAPGESDIGVRNLLYTMILNTRPRMVLEIGCHIGTGAVVIGSALRRNGYGRSISLEPAPHYAAIARRYLDELGLGEISTVEPLFSTQPECAAMLAERGPFDLIFIDARHDYEDALFDIGLSMRLLSENGFIVLHDTGALSPEMDTTARGGVRKALHDFVLAAPEARVIYFELPMWLNACGAAIVCKQRLHPPIQ